MASLPAKGVKGANLRKWLIDSINGLIDYLHASRVRPGDGIMVKETPSGVIVSLAKKAIAGVNNTTGGGTAQDISASVSGGTATIALSGSTSSVEIVGGTSGAVSITGNTNGQIEIDVQGGTSSVGFPNYASPNKEYIHVYNGSETKTYAYAVWLIGSAGVNTSADMDGTVTLYIGLETISLFDLTIGTTNLAGLIVPVSMPIPAGSSFSISASGAAVGNFYAYPIL